MKPFVIRQVGLVKDGRSDFKVIALEPIPPQTVIEVCATLSIPSKLAILMAKANPIFEKKIILDQEEIDREYKVFAELGEMELNKRLDSGQISQEDYASIIASRVNFNSLLEAKTHVMPLGNGMLYGISEYPNLVRRYDSSSKLCSFRTVQYVQEGEELFYYS